MAHLRSHDDHVIEDGFHAKVRMSILALYGVFSLGCYVATMMQGVTYEMFLSVTGPARIEVLTATDICYRLSMNDPYLT